MPFLIADAERHALRAGRNVLGGQGVEAVPLTALAGLAPAAVITVDADGTWTIQRLTAGVVVTVDGESLGSAPHLLAHGARLAVGPCRIMYANPSVFRVERPVCAIGRGSQNDVCLTHDSVSASHATLLLKRGTWYVVDLQSANGTYVDGYRVAAERALPPGGTLRVGDVAMRLRVLATAPKPADPTQALGGLWRRLSKRWGA